jgi:glycerate kinase
MDFSKSRWERILSAKEKFFRCFDSGRDRVTMRTILVVPDKFKGSLTAAEVSRHVKESLASSDPELNIITLPLADGGEGTCELLTTYANGTTIELMVRDPLFRPIPSRYGLSGDRKTAFLEMAQASGLQLLDKYERNPLVTSTVGTGDLIRHALDSGVTRIIMGVGGSGTTDGGMGMADALGVVFYDSIGGRLPPFGENMERIHTMDISGVHPRLQEVPFTVFCDVDNPLHGLRGAAHIFSPQKGASAEMVEQLDAGLRHYEQILRATLGKEVNFPGAGAGGGLPSTIYALSNVALSPGMEYIIAFTNLEEKIASADVIITGEGKIDDQTLSGKVVKGVADLAARYGKPVIAVAGKCTLSREDVERLSLAAVVTLTGVDTDEEEAIAKAAYLLRKRISEFWPSFSKMNR